LWLVIDVKLVCREYLLKNESTSICLNHTVVAGDDIEPSVEEKIQVPPIFFCTQVGIALF
jgi:hypothetical protein